MDLICSSGLHPGYVARIADHKYKSSGKSFVEPYFQPFWNWSVLFVPKSIAPNTLTVLGLLANIFPVALLLYYSPQFQNEIPPIVILLFALGVFIYQTLDALDGLHARQTNSCSQLGELLDHGCDSVSMYFLPVGYFAVLGLGHCQTAMLIEFFILNCIFYTSHWQAFVTGAMEFDRFSVTESLLLAIFFSIVSAIFGVSFWQIKDPIFGIEFNRIQFIFLVIGAAVLFIRFARIISVDGSGKYGTTVANTSVLFPICPLALVLGSALIIAVRSPTQVYENHACLYFMGFGAIMAKVSQNLLIAHMTKTGISLLDPVMLGPFCLLVNLFFDCPLSEYWLLWLSCVWATLHMADFFTRVCIQVADYLNIYIFRIGKPPSRKPTSKPYIQSDSSTSVPRTRSRKTPY